MTTLTGNRKALFGLAAVAVIALAAFGAWYQFIRDDAPPEVSLAGAVGSLDGTDTATAEATEAGGAATSSTSTPEATSESAIETETAEATEASSEVSDGDLTGDWVVSSAGETFVGYRVEEELANIGAKTAVGRTSAVTGSLAFDGAAITAVEVEADLTRLTSDDNRRDRTLGNQGIETNTFPTATFVLTQPIALDGVPEEGIPITVDAVGELTLHGVTREVTIPLEGQLSGGFVVVVGSIDIQFADYDIEPPSALLVLSIEDHGVMEFQLVFEQA